MIGPLHETSGVLAMPRRTALLSPIAVFLICALSQQAPAAEPAVVAEVNKAAGALDAAFERQDAQAITQSMTADHVAVTPYYDAPLNVAEQLATLSDLKYAQTDLSEPEVTLLAPGVALRTFRARLDGTFKGRPIAPDVFVSQLLVKESGAWKERFYQVTALQADKNQNSCKELMGTYLTRNAAKGGAMTSRSLLSFGSAHLVLFTDSGEGGEVGFAPFTDGRGNWVCTQGSDGAIKVAATTLDFTAATSNTAAGIGRLDFELTYNPAGRTLDGAATLYLLPLDGDPLDPAALKDGRQFAIAGRRFGPQP